MTASRRKNRCKQRKSRGKSAEASGFRLQERADFLTPADASPISAIRGKNHPTISRKQLKLKKKENFSGEMSWTG
jgi:hypothetical protein